VQIRFLLGPAGSGKTFRCLTEIREALRAEPDGPPLLLLAPKQATFQLERQLLSDPALHGYTRLQILAFERLADFTLNELAGGSVEVLQEEGRVMVLRALLARHQSHLKIFHATARLPGFAQQLNLLLRDFQRQQLSPQRILDLAETFATQSTLSGKLQDAALLLRDYLAWVQAHRLHDADSVPDLAAAALRELASHKTHLRIGGLWLDGFAEMTPQELDLLAAFLPMCHRATLAFCLDPATAASDSWLSGWSLLNDTFQRCLARAKSIPNADVLIEPLKRSAKQSRFTDSPMLRDLETNWAATGQRQPETGNQKPETAVRLFACANADAEAVLAAREILRFVRGGGRFRDAAVLLRSLDGYHEAFRRVFLRYEIPFFLDHRQPVAHHPLAELTRCALRLTAFGWQHADWFGALKTGLATENERFVDELENEALARGWQGNAWLQPLKLPDDNAREQSVNDHLKRILPPFIQWHNALAAVDRRPDASTLCAAIRELWRQLDVERTLESWNDSLDRQSAIHLTVLEQMQAWLDDVERAFANETLPLGEWLPILEAGLTHLSIGIIPPALDQVLIGTIDRSRNPELKLAILPGWNEGVFPAPPAPTPLLTEIERAHLADHDVRLGPDQRQQISRERYYGYIACTRARERIIITRALQDAAGRPLNPSPLLDRVQSLTGAIEESFTDATSWRDSEHLCELAAPLLRARIDSPARTELAELECLPGLDALVRKWNDLRDGLENNRLSAALAAEIYGRELRSSVSALEDFAACPFKFFAARGLQLQERKEFEFDARDKGSLQHEILREFHHRLRAAGRHWRDLTPAEARNLAVEIGRERITEFSGGRFTATGSARFTAEFLIERTGRLVAALTEWLPQYEFDVEQVELGFGLEPEGLPAWRIDLPDDRALLLRGRIDRIDLCRTGGQTYAVVLDYKSSVRSLNTTKLHHGLELQLLSYLGVLQNLATPEKHFGVRELTPAGVFYVPLNGAQRTSAASRDDLATADDPARRSAYQHSGRFLSEALRHFDNRGVNRGDQFKYALKRDQTFQARGNDAMSPTDFWALRKKVEEHLREYGRRIFEGETDVAPFRIGTQTACDRCDFRASCRFDPWTQPYRDLRAPSKLKTLGKIDAVS
jgi:ATP-dependent helicase/nuclease subunit B